MNKFWRGELPLGLMFWVFFLAVPTALRLILMVSGFVTIADSSNSAGHDFGIIILLALSLLAYYIVVFIATWRSATRYSEANGGLLGRKGVDWGMIAKVAMIVLFFTNGITFL